MMRLAVLSLAISVAAGKLCAQSDPDTRIVRVLNGLRPAIAVRDRPVERWTLARRMAELHVPAVSIAIIDSGRVIWRGAFGVLENGRGDSATTNTLFQAQSISKAIASTAMLALVDAQRVSLDRDVNSYLATWKLPRSRFTDSARVTLRRILSHSAGITPASFPGYVRGAPLPTLVQILRGEPPSNTPAIRVDTFPGAVEQYSGGGMLVMQQLMMDVSGEAFPALVKRLVFDRAGMRASTFEEPLPDSLARIAASGHDIAGRTIPDKWRVFPEMAAAGLWSTPGDLANWALDIAGAWRGESKHVLSPALAREMLTVQKPPAGLGVFLEGSGDSFAFGHTGSTPGYRAEVVMFPGTGRGAVVMTNADQGGQLTSDLIRSIAAEFNWTGRRQSERSAIRLSAADQEGLPGAFSAPPLPDGRRPIIRVWSESGTLFFEFPPFNSKLELYAENRDSFFTLAGFRVVFTRDANDRAQSILLAGQVKGVRVQ